MGKYAGRELRASNEEKGGFAAIEEMAADMNLARNCNMIGSDEEGIKID